MKIWFSLISLAFLFACSANSEKGRYRAFLNIKDSNGVTREFQLGRRATLPNCLELVTFEAEESSGSDHRFFTNKDNNYGSAVKSEGFVNEYTVVGGGCVLAES
jgi:hypothetical protein